MRRKRDPVCRGSLLIRNWQGVHGGERLSRLRVRARLHRRVPDRPGCGPLLRHRLRVSVSPQCIRSALIRREAPGQQAPSRAVAAVTPNCLWDAPSSCQRQGLSRTLSSQRGPFGRKPPWPLGGVREFCSLEASVK